MDGMRIQIEEGIPWAAENIPQFDTPREAWRWFKMHTRFHPDPKNVELLMTLPTFFEDNWFGSPGLGDCDDLVIAVTTTMRSQGWPVTVYLGGRSKSHPVHIWNSITHEGKEYFFDLTEPHFNTERNYRYIQPLYVYL